MVELFANSGDPDQTLHSVASDLGLHCLPITPLGVYRLQWVNKRSAKDLFDVVNVILFFLIFFIKAYVVGIYLNCIHKLKQFKWVPTTNAFIKK